MFVRADVYRNIRTTATRANATATSYPAEQLCLLGGEFFVADDAFGAQIGEPLEGREHILLVAQ